MRIGWFSPVTENKMLKSSIFTRRVLREFAGSVDIEVFVDDTDWSELCEFEAGASISGFPVYPYKIAFLRNQSEPFDVFVFQLEDVAECAFVRSNLRLWPGVVFFHDLNLSNLELSLLEHATTECALNDKMTEVFGPESPRLGDWHARGWSIEVFDNRYPHGASELERAQVVVVSSESALEELYNRDISGSTELCPFPVSKIKDGVVLASRIKLREVLNFSNDEFVIGFNGTDLLNSRVHVMLEAFAMLKTYLNRESRERKPSNLPLSLVWIVPSSKAAKEAEELIERKVQQYPDLAEGVIIACAEHEPGVSSAFCALDVMVALRFDKLRGVPLAAFEAIGRGIPTIVSDSYASAEFPEGSVIKIPHGKAEGEILARALQELVLNEDLRENLALSASEYVETICNPAAVASDVMWLMRHYRDKLFEQNRDLNELLEQRGLKHILDLKCRMRNRDYNTLLETSEDKTENRNTPGLASRVLEKAMADFSW